LVAIIVDKNESPGHQEGTPSLIDVT